MSTSAAVAARARTADCNCSHCGEGVYYVPGIVGPQRWRHVRTDDWRCAPVCGRCGEPATHRIGGDNLDGGQVPGFVTKDWRCSGCLRGQLLIERT